jgi:threonine aldolase
MKCFASDNYSGVHPEVMEALARANTDHTGSYGADPITGRVTRQFKDLFGEDTQVFFAYNGTGANVLSLSALTRSFNAIVCSEWAHIHVDESTAPEKFTGCKLWPLPAPNGKITAAQLAGRIHRVGDPHHPQVKAVSISQSTEYGTVYTVDEIRQLSEVAKRNNLYLHMDGARLANAAVHLNQDFRTFTRDAGVDILSFGGTKNGLMFGEAILIFRPELAKDFAYQRKQGMQLHSKMRFISAQFEALLNNNLWKRNAEHANRMARTLETGLRKVNGVTITQPVEGNGVFAILPAKVIQSLQQEVFFYVWNERLNEVRLMCSFDTQEEEINRFLKKLEQLVTA